MIHVRMSLAFACLGLASCLVEADGIQVAAAGTPDGGPSCMLDADDREMLDHVNAARVQARDCGDEHFAAAEPVTWSCQLEAAAQAHSQDMAIQDFFSHTGSDGTQVSDRVEAQGYNWGAVGENIAAGHSSAAEAVEAWLTSPGHCSNIMSPDFTELGSAVVEAPQREARQQEVSPYWTQVFARPR